MSVTQIDAYKKSSFSATMSNNHVATHDIYERGEGAPIVLVQELPGIGQETLLLADKLVNAGFSVVMPHLFGPVGKVSLVGNLFRVFCLRKEFALFQANKSSPIADWLKALCKKVKEERSVPGVGVIGMCLTGNFAISLMADENVLAAVASQPALPLNKKDALHMSEDDVQQVSARLEATAPMKILRFEKDGMCSAEKEKAIDETFNCGGITRIEKHIMPGKGHSVLTLDFVDEEGHPTYEALQSVIGYFHERLSA
jgi:dienelactone hydrolase